MTQSFLRKYFISPAVVVALGLQSGLAAILCGVPLFDTLGFERAFAAGLLSTLTSPAVAIGLLRKARRGGGTDPGRVAARALAINLAVLLPHVLAGWLVEAFNQPCDPQEGLLFLILCAGGNAAFGTALGLVAGSLVERRGLPTVLLIIMLAGFLGSALYRLYAEPQIFVYSAPFGFWPGSIYDEELGVDATLWAFRGYTLLLALTLIVVARTFVDRERLLFTLRPKRWGLLAAGGLAAATWLTHGSGRSLGFDFDRETVKEHLSRRIETTHFELFIDPSVSREQLENIVLDHEFRHHQLSQFFGRAPEGRIRSFVYRDVNQKARLMGAARTQIARPWAQEIHIDGFDYPHRVLRHELAHIFAGPLASGVFRVPASAGVLVNIGVVEGVAVAADWPVRELTVHGWARAMRALNLAPDMRSTLSATGFWSVSSSRAYTVAGSFLRYLVDQYGIDKLAVLYDDNDFHKAYGRSLDALVSEWETFIDGLPLPEDDLVIAEHRFKRPSIFQKVCAHQAANLARRGYARLGSGDLQGAQKDLEALFQYAPQDPAPLIALSEALGRGGLLPAAQAYAQRALGVKDTTRKSTMRAREALGALAWRLGRSLEAKKAFEEVRAAHLSTPSDRLQQARLFSLERPPAIQGVLRALLLGDLRFELGLIRLSRLARESPEDALIHYLYARALEQAGAYPEAIAAIQVTRAQGLSDPTLRVEADLTLGRIYMAAQSPAAAQQVFEDLARRATRDGDRAAAEDWAQRAAFGQSVKGTVLE